MGRSGIEVDASSPIEGRVFEDNYFRLEEKDDMVFDNCSFSNCNISFRSDVDVIIKNSWICGLGLDDDKHVTFENCYFFDIGENRPVLSTRRSPVSIFDSYISCNYEGEFFSFRGSKDVRVVDTESVGDDCGIFLGSSFDSVVEVENCYISNFSQGFLLLDDSEVSIISSSGDEVGKWIYMKHPSTSVNIENSPKILNNVIADII